jgi:hypothetical protein
MAKLRGCKRLVLYYHKNIEKTPIIRIVTGFKERKGNPSCSFARNVEPGTVFSFP